MSDHALLLAGGVVTFTALGGAYMYLRASFRRHTVKRHAGNALRRERREPIADAR